MKYIKIAFKNLRITRKPILIGLTVAVVSIIIGILLPATLKNHLVAFLMSYYEKNVSFSVLSIFTNNLIAAFIITAGGFLIGLPTLFYGAINFVIIGAFGALSSQNGILPFLLAVLPHGIFELSAIIMCIGFGFTFFDVTFKRFGLTDESSLKKTTINITMSFLFIIIPLLFLASVIEVHITPLILAKLGYSIY